MTTETDTAQRVAVTSEKTMEKNEKTKKALCRLNIAEDEAGGLVGTPSGCSREEFARIAGRLASEGMRITAYPEKKV